MGLLDQGCICDSCFTNTKKLLYEARNKWNLGEREIVFKSYQDDCSDGCCGTYGIDVYVNGFNLNCDGEDAGVVVEALVEFLKIYDVNISFDYGNEE